MTRTHSRTQRTEGVTSDEGAPLQPVEVEAVEGPGAGAQAPLEGGLMIVGSHRGCDLVVDDKAISRRHASIELLRGAVRVRDLGSRNGTRYLGAKISEAVVPVGGSVQLGRTTLRFTPVAAGLPPSDKEELAGLIGRSLVMRQLFAQMERVAPQSVAVLVRGESGSGKDAVARALHALSARAGAPFVVFDCAAVSSNLIETELFGHLKGAFSGATSDRAGAIEAAGEGTLFVDELGELPLDIQPKLLRLLDGGEFRPVGGSRARRSNARIISATHRDLRAEARAGRFRTDLLYRAEVVALDVPPLRERREDIPLLAERFARECTGVDVKLAPSTIAALQGASWPGNVRELRNAVQRAVVLQDGSAAPARQRASASGRRSLKDARAALLEQFERDYLSTVLRAHGGNVSAAAREAGISRMTLYRLLEKHGLRADG